MNPQKRLFSNQQIFHLVWPLLLEQLLNVLVGMIDVLMVAVLGETAVSGVSLVDSINVLFINILAALSSGGTVICSQFIGKNDYKKAGQAAGQLIMLTVGMTSLASFALLFGRKHILSLIFGQVEVAVMEHAYIYCMITTLSFPFLALYNSGASIFRAMGNSKLPMKLAFLMNSFNIVGNAICIFGLKMGVAGVAIPTLLARMLAAILIIIILQKSGQGIRVGWSDILSRNRYMIRRILSIGIPAGLESGMFNFGKLMLQSLVSTLGTASIAGYAVAGNLVTFLYLPGNALGIGLAAVAGQCVGAEELDQAKYYTKLFEKINYAILLMICLPLGIGRYFFIGLYNLSPASVSIAASLLLAHTIMMIVWPIAFLRPNLFRACNRASFTMKVSVSVMWIFRVGLAYVFVKGLHLGVLWVWNAMFIDWFVRLAIYLIAFNKLKKI